ncbi:MAG: protein translocase subunit SecD [Nitrospiraceae bacterium]|nr:protein translocase subunit SecD [Nitrospiraceae bacterium]
MKKKIMWRLALIAAVVVVSLVFVLPNTVLFSYMPGWWQRNMPNRGINLGLDLQGGIHLVFEVEGEKAVESTMERMAQSIKSAFDSKGIKSDVKLSGLDLTVTPAPLDARKIIEDSYPELASRDVQGGVAYRLKDSEIQSIKSSSVDQALETIRNRIDQFGVAEPVIHKQGENEIVVQLPGIKDPARAIQIIGKTALLEFKMLDEESPVAAQLPRNIMPDEQQKVLADFAGKIPAGDEILFGRVSDTETGSVRLEPYLVKDQTLLTGEFLSEANVAIDTRYNEPYVSLRFNPEGAKLFDQITAANVNKRLAIILDNKVYSAPVIRERISGGSAQISGNFTMDEAKDLAIVLKAGALKAPLKMIQNVTVGPSLGKDSIQAGERAGIIAALAVVLFMIFYYKLSGLIADFALVLNIVLLVGAMASLNATLTLPGMAGIILAVGMAVDSNVLMFERMREELHAGKTPRAAVEGGYHKAFWTIFDSHVTTLITAAVLFQFGTGPIKGFAVTLSLGVAINLFTALIGTKTVFDLIYLKKKEVRKLSI